MSESDTGSVCTQMCGRSSRVGLDCCGLILLWTGTARAHALRPGAAFRLGRAPTRAE